MSFVRLCVYCQHDCGYHFVCPSCKVARDLNYIRECGSQVHCFNCHQVFSGPIQDVCDHTYDTEDDIEDNHECKYLIKPGIAIVEINPETKEILESFILKSSLEIYSSNVITDFRSSEKSLTLCLKCRRMPDDVIWEMFPDVYEYLLYEQQLETVAKRYFEQYPTLKRLLSENERWNIHSTLPNYEIHTWLETLRSTLRQILQEELGKRKLFGQLTQKCDRMAIELEKKIFDELFDQDDGAA